MNWAAVAGSRSSRGRNLCPVERFSLAACLCLAPAAALAAPVTKLGRTRDGGRRRHMVDTSVADPRPRDSRLLAATDADDRPQFGIWEPGDGCGRRRHVVEYATAGAGLGDSRRSPGMATPPLLPGGAATAQWSCATPATGLSARTRSDQMREYHPSSGFAPRPRCCHGLRKGIAELAAVALNTPTDTAPRRRADHGHRRGACAPGGVRRVVLSWPGPSAARRPRPLPDVAVLSTGLMDRSWNANPDRVPRRAAATRT